MTELLTQEQLEQEMVDGGRARMAAMLSGNEDRSSASNNPYASAIFRRFVLPLADKIEADIANPRPQRVGKAVPLLKFMDARVIAYLAVRTTINALMAGEDVKRGGARWVMTSIGRTVQHEMLLAAFEQEEPALFHTLLADMQGRLSKSERYKMTVCKMQAKKNGIALPEWGNVGVCQVGLYLTDLMIGLGMIKKDTVFVTSGGKPKKQIEFLLDPEVSELVGEIKDFLIDNCPNMLPCVEKPKDWLGVADGGWHTNGMKRLMPFAIDTEGSWSELADADCQTHLKAINVLQGVQWKINPQILAAVKEVVRGGKSTDEIVSLNERDRTCPDRPDHLPTDISKELMSVEDQATFKVWRRAMTQWFTEQKVSGLKWGRLNLALRVADKLAAYPKLWFVYKADFRGRLYAQTSGVSPQGSDLQKALIHFAVGKPLATPGAVKWFKIAGANMFGFDKASLDDRAAWVDEHEDQIIAAGTQWTGKSLGYLDQQDYWAQADKPLQFLAWCMEYVEWKKSPDTFLSHLPVGMDGSCNGLQNFSALLRDEVGGKATNLTPAALPSDIYQMVADRAAEKLRHFKYRGIPEADGTEETEKSRKQCAAENRYRDAWLAHGLNRSLVKRPVMTKPYGSTRIACVESLIDYFKDGKAPEIAKEDYRGMAMFLSRFVWASINEVVIKADEAMTWLQNASRLILKDHADIRWTSPTGLPVIQRYQQTEQVRLTSLIAGRIRINVHSYTDAADKADHKNGTSPNFVHTLDAAHECFVAIAAEPHGMSLAMIHDDFGCHAADAEVLYRIIREEFVKMYETYSPLQELADRYELPAPPTLGKLDLNEVLSSPYFFS